MSTSPDGGQAAVSNDDWKDVIVPLHVKLVGGLLGVVGLLIALSGAQMVLFLQLRTWHLVIAVMLIGGGIAIALTAPFVIKARAWASVFSLLQCLPAALVTSGWWIYTLVNWTFSPLLMFAAGLSWLALLGLPFTVKPSFRVSRARRELYKA